MFTRWERDIVERAEVLLRELAGKDGATYGDLAATLEAFRRGKTDQAFTSLREAVRRADKG